MAHTHACTHTHWLSTLLQNKHEVRNTDTSGVARVGSINLMDQFTLKPPCRVQSNDAIDIKNGIYNTNTLNSHAQVMHFFCIFSPCTLGRDLGVAGDCTGQPVQSAFDNCCPHERSRAVWCWEYCTVPLPSEHNWDHCEHNCSVNEKRYMLNGVYKFMCQIIPAVLWFT